jgi:hypothetical protein
MQDRIIATLTESIRVPGRMICLLHPWHEPVPLRRVWCLFELYTAIALNAQVIMHFPPEDEREFYSKLRKMGVTGKQEPLVPLIDARQAEASVATDRARIFKEITDRSTMGKFNTQLQQYLEQALRATATGALLEETATQQQQGPAHQAL